MAVDVNSHKVAGHVLIGSSNEFGKDEHLLGRELLDGQLCAEVVVLFIGAVFIGDLFDLVLGYDQDLALILKDEVRKRLAVFESSNTEHGFAFNRKVLLELER